MEGIEPEAPVPLGDHIHGSSLRLMPPHPTGQSPHVLLGLPPALEGQHLSHSQSPSADPHVCPEHFCAHQDCPWLAWPGHSLCQETQPFLESPGSQWLGIWSHSQDFKRCVWGEAQPSIDGRLALLALKPEAGQTHVPCCMPLASGLHPQGCSGYSCTLRGHHPGLLAPCP